ncbi:MAG: hypothetical protein IKC76_00950 [Firmicutes bacterium]|nr:hypothetical protein [Bacillota bacterium]
MEQRHLSIRANSDLLDKFYYVAKYYGRSGSAQILYLMRCFVEEFEQEHGAISDEELQRFLSGEK